MKRWALLSGLLLVALCSCGADSQAVTSPLEANTTNITATLTPDEREKISQDLLAVVEWEETHPDKGQEIAPDYFEFEADGRIRCFIPFDPDFVVVSSETPGLPVEEQPGGQIITRHNGQVLFALEYYNAMIALLSLGDVKGLAQEESIVRYITPIDRDGQKVLVGANLGNLAPTPIPPKIDPELLTVIEWEESHPDEGRKVAPDNFVFRSDGWIDCTVRLDPHKIIVTSRWSADLAIKKQPGGQLVIQHGGQPISGIEYTNSIGIWIPLANIKGLAQEDAVMSIVPNRLIKPPSLITATRTPF